MGRGATLLGVLVLAVAGGAAGAWGYEELLADDDRAAERGQQAPLSASAVRGGAGDDAEGLTAAQIYDRAAPGVVKIQAVIVQQTDSPFGPQQQQGASTGTGFVVDDQGNIVTNAHVVLGARRATVQFGSDRQIDAEVVGTDVNSDLAVIRIDPGEHDLTALPLGSTKGLRVGDPVVAIGNPFGLDRTLTTGVVSALARRIEGLNGFAISDVVQTDAAINQGNSGGPLLDGAGRVIGVNSQIQTETGGNVGIGFAVPVERLKQVLPALKKGEQVKVAFFGVTTVPVDESLKDIGITAEGLLVADVVEGSGADRAGIRPGRSATTVTIEGSEVPLGGDIILGVDGRRFADPVELADYIAGKQVGDEIRVELQRAGKKRTVTVELGNRPATAGG